MTSIGVGGLFRLGGREGKLPEYMYFWVTGVFMGEYAPSLRDQEWQ